MSTPEPLRPGDRVRWKRYTGTVLTNEGDSGMVDIDGWSPRRWWWEDSGYKVERVT